MKIRRPIVTGVFALLIAVVLYALVSGMWAENERRETVAANKEDWEKNRKHWLRTSGGPHALGDDLAYRGVPAEPARQFAGEFIRLSKRRAQGVPATSLAFQGPDWSVSACLPSREPGKPPAGKDTVSITAKNKTEHYEDGWPSAGISAITGRAPPACASGSAVIARDFD